MRFLIKYTYMRASLVVQLVKNPLAMQEDLGSIPGLGRFPGEGKGYPFQYSSLENSMDCIVHEVAKSWTWLSSFHFCRRQKEQNKNIWKHNGWKSPKSDENSTHPQSCTNFKKDKFKSTPTVSCKMKTKKKSRWSFQASLKLKWGNHREDTIATTRGKSKALT